MYIRLLAEICGQITVAAYGSCDPNRCTQQCWLTTPVESCFWGCKTKVYERLGIVGDRDLVGIIGYCPNVHNVSIW